MISTLSAEERSMSGSAVLGFEGCFTLSTSSGMGKAATVVYSVLANLLSTHRNVPYLSVMGWLPVLWLLSFMHIHGSSGHPYILCSCLLLYVGVSMHKSYVILYRASLLFFVRPLLF